MADCDHLSLLYADPIWVFLTTDTELSFFNVKAHFDFVYMYNAVIVSYMFLKYQTTNGILP